MQIFPNNQLGSDTDMLSQVRSGGVEFFTLSPLILSTLVPTASISGIGFAFPNYDAVWKAMDGDLGAYVRGQIGKANLVVMDKIWDNGFRQMTSSKADQRPPTTSRASRSACRSRRSGPRCSPPSSLAGQHQLRRDLHRAADQGRRRPGEPARDHRHRQAVRGAEVSR